MPTNPNNRGNASPVSVRAPDARFPVFLSVVIVVRNQNGHLPEMLRSATRTLQELATDYEILVVDNASTDDSLRTLASLTAEGGLPNLLVFCLTKEVDWDIASAAGLENALGDFIAVIDPAADDIAFVPEMLEQAVNGADVVFARNDVAPPQTLAYRAFKGAFSVLYKWFSGIHLAKDAPGYRLLSRRVANFILQHPSPSVSYRHLPATGGFSRVNLAYRSPPATARAQNVLDSIDRGIRLLVSTTRGPMRLVTTLSIFGAVSNLLYSGYVIVVAIVKTDVAPGWVTLSLQQSGMFLLISLVLLVLSEYILNMVRLSTDGPPYHVAREFTSAVMTSRSKLNVEDAHAGAARRAPPAAAKPERAA
jgi:hypothetical protein